MWMDALTKWLFVKFCTGKVILCINKNKITLISIIKFWNLYTLIEKKKNKPASLQEEPLRQQECKHQEQIFLQHIQGKPKFPYLNSNTGYLNLSRNSIYTNLYLSFSLSNRCHFNWHAISLIPWSEIDKWSNKCMN